MYTPHTCMPGPPTVVTMLCSAQAGFTSLDSVARLLVWLLIFFFDLGWSYKHICCHFIKLNSLFLLFISETQEEEPLLPSVDTTKPEDSKYGITLLVV